MRTKSKALSEVYVPGNFLNESASGAASTYTAILGRMAAENGEQVSWESMQHSNESIDPNLNLPQFD